MQNLGSKMQYVECYMKRLDTNNYNIGLHKKSLWCWLTESRKEEEASGEMLDLFPAPPLQWLSTSPQIKITWGSFRYKLHVVKCTHPKCTQKSVNFGEYTHVTYIPIKFENMTITWKSYLVFTSIQGLSTPSQRQPLFLFLSSYLSFPCSWT